MTEVDTDVSFAYWLRNANRGDSVVYYNGFLLRDREILVRNGLMPEKFPDRIKAAIMAWKNYLNGAVALTQRKRGDFEYEYIATKV